MNNLQVKRLNFTTMKKQIFTLIVMIALVVVAGSAWAQEKLAPIIGNSYQYEATGLKSGVGDDVYFYVTAAAVTDDPASSSIAKDALSTSDNIWWTDDPVSITDLAATTAAINITWKTNSNNVPYKLWIVVLDGVSGCSNYRFLPITPILFDISIAVVGLGTDALNGDFADIATNTLIGNDDCIPTNKRIGAEWDATATTPADGSFYLYFRIKLESPTTPESAWKFTPSFPAFENDGTTSVTLTPALTYEYSADLASWAPSTGEITVPNTDADNTVYIRVIRTLITEREPVTKIRGQIASVTYGTYTPSGDADATPANNTAADFTIRPVAQIGGFN